MSFRVREQDKEKALEYYRKFDGNYEKAVGKGFLRHFRERERAAVLRFADFRGPGTMVDVGAGEGFYARNAKAAGMSVLALDAIPALVERLRTIVDEALLVDIEKMDLNRTFDCVVCAGVLDFVRQPEVAFENLSRLVGPQGKLVILAPRISLGGQYYRFEKRMVGMRINLYPLDWFKEQADRHDLQLVDYTHPLPSNRVVLLKRAARPV